MPKIESIDVGENSANVSWSPSKHEQNNPGGRFYVEYVKTSDAGFDSCTFLLYHA